MGRTISLPFRPLTSRQERNLMTYLDDHFLQITRNFKKRAETSSTLRTLHAYLEASRHLLKIILQIPPVDPSTSLRTAYLLRLTGDVLSSITGYRLTSESPPTNGQADGPIASTANLDSIPLPLARSALQDLLDFLDDLDQACVAVLQGQVWDPSSGAGVDLVVPIDSSNVKSTPPSQTEVARLRSLLIGGQSALEEWLGEERLTRGGEGEEDDLSATLERMGLLDEFDELFSKTLDFLGGLGGVIVEPGSTVEDMDIG